MKSNFSVPQESVQPACIIRPRNAQDVSLAVSTLVELHGKGESCLFAIRSGGHTTWAGTSNIQGGAVIDLGCLNDIQLSEDKKTVSVGVGATWGEVYEVLDALGLSANGGRASTPGQSCYFKESDHVPFHASLIPGANWETKSLEASVA